MTSQALRIAALTLAVGAAPTFAQTPSSNAWRAAASGGFASGIEALTASLAVERTVRGPVSVNVRASVYTNSRHVDDIAGTNGVALDVCGGTTTHGRLLDVCVGMA